MTNTSIHRVAIHNRQSVIPVDKKQIRAAIRAVLQGEQVGRARIDVAVVDNQEIHALNRRFLEHDFPTDVISFSLSEPHGPLEGDLMVSAEMARDAAAGYDWSVPSELILYAIHGTLHLVGYDDIDDASRTIMRAKERHYLLIMGIVPPDNDGSETFNHALPPSDISSVRRNAKETKL